MTFLSRIAYCPNLLYKISKFKILSHISQLHVKDVYFHAIILLLPLSSDYVYVLLYVHV
jgi:hypothetical protein